MTTRTIVHTQDLFQQVFERFKVEVARLELVPENFIDFLVTAMETVEKYSREIANDIKLHGLEKKELVEEIIQQFFDDVDKWVEDRQTNLEEFRVVVQYFMDRTIDLLIAAAKGQLGFNAELRREKRRQRCLAHRQRRVNDERIVDPKDVGQVEDLVNEVYDTVRKAIVNKKFTVSNFIVLVTMVMQILESHKDLTGTEKKALAIRVIKRLVNEIPFTDEDRVAVGIIIDTTLPKTIDYLIMAANGDLDFGEMIEKVKNIFSCCRRSTETE